MAVLVCGGAGYIGSHAVRALLERGEEVAVADSLLTGFIESVPGGAAFYKADIRDKGALSKIFDNHPVREVIHFAASSQVGESMAEPLKYFGNNVGGTIALLEVMRERGAGVIVFSSSAAVYGEPETVPIFEEAKIAPKSPYGESKAMMETIIGWAEKAYGFKFASLRYFNVAGADKSGLIGEAHKPETHLVPIVLQVPLGQRDKVTVFGDDYQTPDGTCVRDYVHVTDLVEAHVLALERLRGGCASESFNLGSESGFSVLEIIKAAERVVGRIIPFSVGPRREGDPDRLVASSQKAREVLGWSPRFGTVEAIIETAWAWHKGHPHGYRA
ncbi:MAG: UDP-glucose 4-epimerase GalE [Deltaproteobacteria bacterium]|jgi:UDP-glucose 4-epimerase|nr:UDP-glucose 4-epimerase GalE [Deltaproteobacteria bacterium]